MKKKLAAVVVAIVLVSTGCTGGGGDPSLDDHPASRALAELIEQISKGQYGRIYRTLHPSQRVLVDEATFIDCYSDFVPAVSSTANMGKVEDLYTESMTIPGTDETVEATAITTEVSMGGHKGVETLRMVEVDDGWTWTWTEIEECTGS